MKKQLAKNVRTAPARLAVQPDILPSVQPSGRVMKVLKSGQVVRKKTFHLPTALVETLEVHAVRTGQDQQDVVIAALKQYLGQE